MIEGGPPNMKNVVLIPLDERPCNLNFVPFLSKDTDYNIITPPLKLMGDKKIPADTDALWDWLIGNAENFNYAILSIDMLVYGGIIPSRLHHLSIDECEKRLNNIKKLKEINPALKIYAFNLIMRCPSYSSSDEEPDYYEHYGKQLFQYGCISHKIKINTAKEEEKDTLNQIKTIIPSEVLEDYTKRRSINSEINKMVINMAKDNFFDFLVIPQDDSAPYGFTALDQQKLREYISYNHLDFKVYMYPGADEVSMTLFARLINEDKALKPLVYVKYSSTKGPFIIPLYEDRMLNETIKYQILCAGCLPCSDLSCADIVLMVNSPAEKMYEAYEQGNFEIDYNVNKNTIEFTEFIGYIINIRNMPCAVADVAYANGGDLKLIDNLSQKGLLFKLAAYAGWNTNSNTLGTAICQSVIFSIYGNTQGHLNFIGLRYVEDAAYCSFVRKYVTDNYLPNIGLDYFHSDGKRGLVSEIVKRKLMQFSAEKLFDNYYGINITDTYMPWSRMFEVGLEVQVNKKISDSK